MKKLSWFATLLLLSLNALSQDCNCSESVTDFTVTNGQTVVVNAYYPGNGSALAGSTSITIGAKRTFTGPTDNGGTIAIGDLLMVIQMQGTEIDPTIPDMETIDVGGADNFNSTDYGDGPGGLDHEGFLDNSSFIAGQFEYVIATNAIGAGGGTLTIQNGLTNSYIANTTPSGNVGRSTFQIIKVGNFHDLNVNTGGEITTIPWNGSTGGIIAIDALGTFDLDGRLDADFAGFRGGLLDPALDNNDVEPGWRGEGIAGSPTQVYHYNDDFSALTSTRGLATGYPGGSATVNSDFDYGTGVFSFDMTYNNERGPGAPGNAGGAGLVNNGGGGGSNGGAGGDGATSGDGAGGDFLIPAGGGAVLSLELGSKLYLGGGGGSGGMATPDNTGFPIEVQSGHPGGGAIIVRADTLTGTGGVVTANGDDGGSFNATGTNVASEDGAGGGGGAGGTIIFVTSSEDITGVTFNAIGGDGSSLTGVQQFASPDGGGGGGSGGNVTLVRRGGSFSPTPTSIDVTGGAAGGTQGTPSADSQGGDGATELLTTPPASNLDCPLITLADAQPGGVADAIVWFTPEQDVTYNGSNQITAWTDFSGSNFILTNTSLTGITGTTPDFIEGSFVNAEASSNPDFNFNASVSFNEGAETTDYLAFENFTNLSTGAITVFSVANFAGSTPNDQTIFSYLPNDSQDDELDLGITNDGGSDGIRKSVLDNNVDRAGDLRDGITRIIATDYNNSDANIYVNNGAATNSALSAGTFDASGTFVLGQDLDDFATPAFDNNRELQGQLGDVIYFSRILTATERQQVTSYLAIKYGVTMDQTTDQDYLNSIGEAIYPISTDGGNYAAYDNDIAGIGRDDGSRLNQLRSKSINSDAILTASNTGGFSIDRQFIIWGNNDAGTTFNTTEISSGITNRIQREWRVAVANAAGPINLSFDLSGTTNTPLITDNVALVIDDDGDFSNGFLRTVSANSWDLTTAAFNNVTLNDDEVLTIATVPDSPGGVNGMVLWLKADVGVTSVGGNGTEVTLWADQSGAGSDFASQVFAQPEIGPTLNTSDPNFNNNPSFDFTDNYLAVDNYSQFPVSSDFSFISVQRADVTATDGNGAIVSYGEEEFDIREMDAITIEVDNGNVDFGADADIRSQTAVMSFQWDEGNGGTDAGSLFINGTGDGQNPITITEPNIQANLDFVIGQESDNDGGAFEATDNYIGELAEILIFDSFLSVIDRTKIESYLAIKYGITLDGDETDYIASDGNFIYETVIAPADYNNDIGGIGRDDISQLDQRSSQSVNADAVVTMALTDNGGTFGSPNAFTANLSFLAWGNDNDDNGTIEDVTTDVPSNVISRLDRQWRVQEKGTVGNVTLEIDISGVDPNGVETDFTGRTASSFQLLIDDGGDFDNGVTRSVDATSFNAGTEIITFDVDFIDGDVFTVATSFVATGPGGVTNNLLVWLRPDRDVLNTGATAAMDGEEVGTWTDQLGGLDFTRDAIGTATDAGPTFIASDLEFNSNPSLQWNAAGNGDYLARANFSFPATDFSLFTTQRIDAVNEANSHVLNYFEGSRILELRNFDAVNFEVAETNANTGENVTDMTSIIAFDYDQSSPSVDLNVNGTASTSNPETTASTGALSQNGTLLLGERINNPLTGFANARRLIGKLGDIIMYDGIVSATDQDRIESYLAVKYGITMNAGDYDYESANGTIFFPGNSDADFASYRADVAGIGRDDNSDFEQLTSSSVNATGVLSVTKTSGFGGDNQFVMWGNNGTVVASSTATDFPSGIESRLDREWRIKLTSSPTGTLDFTFDLSTITVDQASDLRILVDADGDFSDATILNPTVIQNGDDFTFSGIDLSNFTDEDLFTIGTVDVADSPLPLNWLSFSVKEQSGNALLDWSTTNEIGVSHFEVERSANGTDFQVIGNLNAANISDALNTYDFTDTNPLEEINYYRIKQVDFDGLHSYTDINFVIISGNAWEVNIYPNPASSFIQISTTLPTTGRMRVIDLNGRVVMDYPMVNDQLNRLDISNLKTGIYQFEFNSVIGVKRIRFVKD